MLQPLKPSDLEPVHLNKRSHHKEKPTHHNKEWPSLAITRESPHMATKRKKERKRCLKKRKDKLIFTIIPKHTSKKYIIMDHN